MQLETQNASTTILLHTFCSDLYTAHIFTCPQLSLHVHLLHGFPIFVPFVALSH